MYLDNLLRSQFGKPSGVFGSLFLGPLMNLTNMRLVNAAVELLEPRLRDIVLDIGFGGAQSLLSLTEKVRRGKIVGVDYSADMVEQANQLIRQRRLVRRVRVECASVARLPFPAATFDKVLTVNSIYYWPHIVANLRETRRVMKPGGRLVAGFRSRSSLAPFTQTWEKFSLYEPEEFAGLMQKAGFKILSAEHRDRGLLLDMVLIAGERK